MPTIAIKHALRDTFHSGNVEAHSAKADQNPYIRQLADSRSFGNVPQ